MCFETLKTALPRKILLAGESEHFQAGSESCVSRFLKAAVCHSRAPGLCLDVKFGSKLQYFSITSTCHTHNFSVTSSSISTKIQTLNPTKHIPDHRSNMGKMRNVVTALRQPGLQEC